MTINLKISPTSEASSKVNSISYERYTKIHLMVRPRFGEVSSCCCLTALPGPAWVLLKYVLLRLFLSSVEGSGIPDANDKMALAASPHNIS